MTTVTERDVTKNIRKIRLEKGYKQETIAQLLNYSRSNYSYKEQGKCAFSVKDILRLSQIFQIPVENLFSPFPETEKGPVK